MSENPEDDYVPDDDVVASDSPDARAFRVPDDASSLTAPAPAASAVEQVQRQLSERTADLQRLQAEYVNYKKRVDRDRHVARGKGVEAVVRDLLPVLDAIEAAKQHEELDGGFKLVVDALEKVAAKYGLAVFGEVGDEFDPHLHEALMHVPLEGDHEVTVISAVIQKGITLEDRVIRPARVGVADPS